MNYDLHTLRRDLFGGITAMVVALPVALAFDVASGLEAAAGLYGAIAVGFSRRFSVARGSRISGPTPSMIVAMATHLSLWRTFRSSEIDLIIVVVPSLEVLCQIWYYFLNDPPVCQRSQP